MTKPSVLIIDDEQNVRDAVAEALKREGYDIFQADNGKEGLSLVHNLHPTVIILDLKMPGMDGLKFLANLQLSASVISSIIVLSGHGGVDGRRECYDSGINIFLRKPFDMYEIRGVVRNAVALHHLTSSLDKVVVGRNADLEDRVRELTALKELFQQWAPTDERNPNILEEIDRMMSKISLTDDELRGQCDR